MKVACKKWGKEGSKQDSPTHSCFDAWLHLYVAMLSCIWASTQRQADDKFFLITVLFTISVLNLLSK